MTNKKKIRNNKEDDPNMFITYVRGWAGISNLEEEAKILYFRDHLAGEPET